MDNLSIRDEKINPAVVEDTARRSRPGGEICGVKGGLRTIGATLFEPDYMYERANRK